MKVEDFGSYLFSNANCNDLRLMVRAMGIRTPTRTRKGELVTLIIEEINEPTKVETERMLKRAGDRPSHKELLNTIRRITQKYEKIQNVSFDKMSCPMGSRKPKYGKRGTSDCDSGFYRKDGNGCCIRIESTLQGIWDPSAIRECGVNCDPRDRKMLSTFEANVKKDEKQYFDEVNNTVFMSEKQAAYVKDTAARFRMIMVGKIARSYEDILEMVGGGDEVCDLSEATVADIRKSGISIRDGLSAIMSVVAEAGKAAGSAVKAVGNAAMYMVIAFFKGLWWIMTTIFGWGYGAVKKTFGAVKYVAGKAVSVTMTLVSQAQKIAFFIMQSPRQARMAFFFANKLKEQFGAYIAVQLKDSTLVRNIEAYFRNYDRERKIGSYEQFRGRVLVALGGSARNASLQRRDIGNIIEKVGIGFAGALEKSGARPTPRKNENPDKESWADGAYKAAVGVYDVADKTGAVSSAIDKVAESGVVSKVTANAGKWMGRMFGAVVKSLPGGAILATGSEIVGEIIGDATGSALEQAMEYEAYNRDVMGAFDELMKLMDPTPFLAKMPSIQNHFPHLWWRLATGAVVGEMLVKYGLDVMEATPAVMRKIVAKAENNLNITDTGGAGRYEGSDEQEDLDLTPRG